MGEIGEDNDPFEEDIVFDQTGLLGSRSSYSRQHPASGGFIPTFMLFIRTVFLCVAFVGLGLCASVSQGPVIHLEAAIGIPTDKAFHIFTAHSIGMLAGGLLGLVLFEIYNRQFLIFISLIGMAFSIAVLPFTIPVSYWWTLTTLTALGAGLSFLFTGSNVLCLDLWGKQGGASLQSLHFSFAVGAFIAPILVHPFLAGPYPPQFSKIPLTNESMTTSVITLSSQEFHRMLRSINNLSDVEPIKGAHISNLNLSGISLDKLTLPNSSLEVESLRPKESIVMNSSVTEKSVSSAGISSSLPGGKLENTENASSLPGSKSENAINSSSLHGSKSQNKSTSDLLNFEVPNPKAALGNPNLITGIGNASSLPGIKSENNVNISSLTGNKSENSSAIDLLNSKVPKPKPAFTNANLIPEDSKWKRLPNPKDNLKPTSNIKINTTINVNNTINSNITFTGSVISTLDLLNNSTSQTANTTHVLPIESNSTKPPITDVLHTITNYTSTTSTQPEILPAVTNSGLNTLTHVTEIMKEPRTEDNTSHVLSNSVNINSVHNFNESNSPSDVPILPSNVSMPILTTTLPLHKDGPENHSTSYPVSVNNESQNLSTSSVYPTKIYNATITELHGTTPNNKKYVIDFNNNSYPSWESNKDVMYQDELGNNDFTDYTVSGAGKTFVSEPEVLDLKEFADEDDEASTISVTASFSEGSVLNNHGQVHQAKPGTFSNISESNSHFIESLLEKFKNYGVTSIHVVYLCIGGFLLVNALISVVIMCHNPREPRSKQEDVLSSELHKSQVKIFIIIFAIYMFTAEALQGAVHHLLASSHTENGLPIVSKNIDGQAIFWGLVCSMRFLCILISGCLKVKPGKILVASTFFMVLGTIFLCIGTFDKQDFLWGGIVVCALGLAPVLPTCFLWMAEQMRVTHRMCALMIIISSFGNSLTHTTLTHVLATSHLYAYILIGISVCSLIFLLVSFCLLYKSQASKTLAVPIGYQLANQDDDETLELTRPTVKNFDNMSRRLSEMGEAGQALLID